MNIELHVFPASPRAFKVLACANHLNLSYELRFVDLIKGDQKAPAYSALNPNMRMPTLKHDEFVLWESNAILEYLALQQPERTLLPKDERARLDVERWLFWDAAHWDPACAVFTFENVVKPRLLGIPDPDLTALEKGAESFHRAAAVLDTQLRGRRYVTGDALTVADFALGGALVHADASKLPIANYGEIRRWLGNLTALPGWRRALTQAVEVRAAA
jgi:glutathione S-transferase